MKVLTDKEILDLIKSHGYGINLKLATDKFSHFDAVDDWNIVEFKLRMDTNEWPSYYIEGLKCMNNYHFAQKTDRKFYMVYVTNKRIIFWNVSEILEKDGIKFNVQKLPMETSNPQSKKINKCVYLMPVSKAFKVINR